MTGVFSSLDLLEFMNHSRNGEIPLSSHDTINETRQQVIYNGSLVNFLVTMEGSRLI